MIHEQIDGYHELTAIYADPPTPTVGRQITWRQFWAAFANAQSHDATAWVNLDIAGWLLEHNAFGNEGARRIKR